MKKVKELARKIPGVIPLYRAMRSIFTRDTEAVFTHIFRGNRFGGKESISGSGSDLSQTRVIIGELPLLLKKLSVLTMLDIPCGDFYWMNSVDLNGVDYVGGDIVKEIIQNNEKRKKDRDNLHFRRLNIITDELLKVDLIFCRDCLVHFCYADIFQALCNICNSDSKYLLTTTFPSQTENQDIFTGQWRPLNLEISPFDFPKPLELINEGCTEGDGAYSDKSLGLWRIHDIKRSLATCLFSDIFRSKLMV